MNNRIPILFLLSLFAFAFIWSTVESFMPEAVKRELSSSPQSQTSQLTKPAEKTEEVNEFTTKFNAVYDRLSSHMRIEYIKMVLQHENDFSTDAAVNKLSNEPAELELLPLLISEFIRTPSGPLQKKLFIELNKYTQQEEPRERVFEALSDRIAKGPIGANEWFLSHVFADLTEEHTPALEKALSTMPQNHPNKPLVRSLIKEMNRLNDGA